MPIIYWTIAFVPTPEAFFYYGKEGRRRPRGGRGRSLQSRPCSVGAWGAAWARPVLWWRWWTVRKELQDGEDRRRWAGGEDRRRWAFSTTVSRGGSGGRREGGKKEGVFYPCLNMHRA